MTATDKASVSGSEQRQLQTMLHVRVSAEELAELDRQAGASRLSRSALVRTRLFPSWTPPRQSRRRDPDHVLLAKAMAVLGPIGGNLNQLARSANRGRHPSEEVLTNACQELLRTRDTLMRALGFDPELSM